MERILTGMHGIEEALRSKKKSGKLYISRKSSRIDAIKSAAVKSGLNIENISPSEMNKRFGEDNRGVVLALYEKKTINQSASWNKSTPNKSEELGFEEIVDSIKSENSIIMILDGITDPHNYGAILRSADQFGVDLVVSRSRRSASESDTVARTSSGAVNFVNSVVVKNLSRSVDYLKQKGFWVYCADMGDEPLYTKNLKGRTAIVMGSEGRGVSRLIAEKCDGILSIPSEGNIDSLNVSVAAGVILYEIKRQQSV